jgi:hypothetical protein
MGTNNLCRAFIDFHSVTWRQLTLHE